MYVWLVDRDQLKLVWLGLNLQNISKEFYRNKKAKKWMRFWFASFLIDYKGGNKKKKEKKRK
jgi:hypothetical protein